MDTDSTGLRADIDDDGIAIVTIDRPDKRNAMNLAMWQRIGELFNELAGRRNVRAIILTGAGEHFCAGADISEFETVRNSVADAKHYDDVGEHVMTAIRDCAKPTIAAVSGYGVGGGCGLALACDLRVGDQTTQMGIPAARLGIVYGVPDCELLIRQVGLATAKLVLFSGRFFDAGECARLRLIDVLADGAALDGARDLAATFAANAPLSVSGAKVVLNVLAAGEATARAGEIDALMDAAVTSRDYREAAAAFRDKRKPVFTGQ